MEHRVAGLPCTALLCAACITTTCQALRYVLCCFHPAPGASTEVSKPSSNGNKVEQAKAALNEALSPDEVNLSLPMHNMFA